MADRDISREITGSTYTANGLASPARTLKKLLHLHAYETSVVHRLHNTELDVRMNFVNWYLHVVHKGETYSSHSFRFATLGYILVETRTLHYHVLSAQKPVLIHKGTLHDAKFGV